MNHRHSATFSFIVPVVSIPMHILSISKIHTQVSVCMCRHCKKNGTLHVELYGWWSCNIARKLYVHAKQPPKIPMIDNNKQADGERRRRRRPAHGLSVFFVQLKLQIKRIINIWTQQWIQIETFLSKSLRSREWGEENRLHFQLIGCSAFLLDSDCINSFDSFRIEMPSLIWVFIFFVTFRLKVTWKRVERRLCKFKNCCFVLFRTNYRFYWHRISFCWFESKRERVRGGAFCCATYFNQLPFWLPSHLISQKKKKTK